MKKFFFIIESLGKYGGGAENVIINICNQLAKLNKNVYLIALTNKDQFYKKNISCRVKLVVLPFEKSFYSILTLNNFIKKNNPYLVVSTSFHISVLAGLLKIFQKKSFFLIIRISNSMISYFENFNQIKMKFIFYIFLFMTKYYDRIICPSVGQKNQLKNYIDKKFFKKIYVISNPVNLQLIIKKSLNNKIHAKLFNKLFFLTVGRLVAQKDHFTLIKAFNYFLSIYKGKKKYYLAIIGRGVMYEKLKKFIVQYKLSQRVFLLKHKKNPYPYIRKSKIFILSSRYEGYPNVLLEAQALKKKIISTNCLFGPSEILSNGRFGYLVNPGDYKKLGLTMLKSLNSKNNIISLDALKKRNSLDLVASKYNNLFDNLNEK